MSFVQRQLSFQFNLASGSFGSGGGNSATITNVRATVKVVNAGVPYQGQLSADIFGLSLDLMNQLTTYGQQTLSVYGKNTIIVQAGDDQSGMTTIFTGYINACFCNAQAQPHVSLHVEATGASLQAVTPVAPTSIKGSADVAQMVQGLAGQMGMKFENNGVNVKLSNPYYSSSAWAQAVAIAKHAGIGMCLECGTLAIFPAGGSRQGGPAMISPQTGLVGYPAFYSGGIVVRTLFDPTLGLKQAGQITVQSDLKPACGNWAINSLEYELEALTPHGEWFAIATCSKGSGSVGPA